MKNDILININGEFFDRETARISVFDRGFLYGDSLYEVLRTYDGRPFLLEGHLKRLQRSADLCHLNLHYPISFYEKAIRDTLQKFKLSHTHQDAYIRLIVTRGIGRIGFAKEDCLTPPQLIVIAQPVNPPSNAVLEKGLRLQIAQRIRNPQRALDPAMKSGNYLNNLLAFLEAREEGLDDAILCDQAGFVTEGTTFNVFYIKKQILVTPPLESGILVGLTREQVLRLAQELGFETREVPFPPDRLFEADEVFITSSIKEVFPVTQINQESIGTGKPGKETLKLREAFSHWIQAHV